MSVSTPVGSVHIGAQAAGDFRVPMHILENQLSRTVASWFWRPEYEQFRYMVFAMLAVASERRNAGHRDLRDRFKTVAEKYFGNKAHEILEHAIKIVEEVVRRARGG